MLGTVVLVVSTVICSTAATGSFSTKFGSRGNGNIDMNRNGLGGWFRCCEKFSVILNQIVDKRWLKAEFEAAELLSSSNSGAILKLGAAPLDRFEPSPVTTEEIPAHRERVDF